MSGHYETLDLKPNATLAEVKRAYKRLAMLHHPDKNPGNEQKAQEKFVKIQAAYDAITKPASAKNSPESTYRADQGSGSAFNEKPDREYPGFDHRDEYSKGSSPHSEKSRPRYSSYQTDDDDDEDHSHSTRGRSYSYFGDAHTSKPPRSRQHSFSYGISAHTPKYPSDYGRASNAPRNSFDFQDDFHPTNDSDPHDADFHGQFHRRAHEQFRRDFHEQMHNHHQASPGQSDYFGDFGQRHGMHSDPFKTRRSRSYTHAEPSRPQAGRSYTSYEPFETQRGDYDDDGKSSYSPSPPRTERSQSRYGGSDDSKKSSYPPSAFRQPHRERSHSQYNRSDDYDESSRTARRPSFTTRRPSHQSGRPHSGPSFEQVTNLTHDVWNDIVSARSTLDDLKYHLRRQGHRGSSTFVEKLTDKLSKYKAKSSELEEKSVRIKGDQWREKSRWRHEAKRVSQLKHDLMSLDEKVGEKMKGMDEITDMLGHGKVSEREWDRVLRKLSKLTD